MPPEPKLVINIPDGAVTIKFPPAAAQDLLTHLYDFTAKIQQTERTAPAKPIEYRYQGDLYLEIFGNPNIWPSSFAAKILITLRDDRMRLTVEVGLIRFMEDVQQFLENT